MNADPAHAYCAELVRRVDRDRYLAALFAPAAQRRRILAVYALNAELAGIAGAVREPLLGEIRLQWWREGLRGRRDHPVLEALAESTTAHSLNPAMLERTIDARKRDLSTVPARDMREVESYAEGTSGVVAVLAAESIGGHDPVTESVAMHVGTAWGLVSLLRALPHHGGGQGSGLLAGLVAERGMAEVARDVATRARAHLAEARGERDGASKQAIAALLPATVADLYLRRLDRADYEPGAGTLEVSGPRVQLRLLRKALTGNF